MAVDQELLKIQTKIGNSFLRAYYPIDYRSNQNILKNIDKLLDREVRGLRALSSTTGQITGRIGRTLSLLGAEMEGLYSEIDSLENTIRGGDEVLGSRISSLEQMASNIFDFLPEIPMIPEGGRRGRKPKTKKPPKTPKERAKPTEPNKPKPEPSAEEKERLKREKIDKWREQKTGEGKGGGRFGGKAVGTANILLAAYTLWQMWTEIQELDPNMKKGAYRQAVAQIITRTVFQVGLAWTGAFVAATVAGSLTGGLGAIPGFLVGLAGGAIAQYAFGDSVDQIVDQVIDYLYTGDDEEEAPAGDASIINKEAPTPTPPLEPLNQQTQQASTQVPLAPPIQGPTPPAPPMEQTVDSPVTWPVSLPPAAMEFFAPPKQSSTSASQAISDVERRAQMYVPQSAEEQNQYMMQGASDRIGSPNLDPSAGYTQDGSTGSLNTSQDLGGGIAVQPGQGISGSTVQVIEAYGPHRPGRPVQRIRDIATRAAEKVGMSQITFTSGVGDWISEKRRASGQKTTKHSEGIALDVTGFANPEQRVAFMQAARQLGAGGIGAYNDGSVHIDLGPSREWDNAVGVPGLAEGAKVSKPTLALIGEAGEPEYVVPQSKAIKFAHEMIAARPRTRTKKHTHVVVVPILT